jgi:hypothetical protein
MQLAEQACSPPKKRNDYGTPLRGPIRLGTVNFGWTGRDTPRLGAKPHGLKRKRPPQTPILTGAARRNCVRTPYNKPPSPSTSERFALVSRALLAIAELCPTDALALTYVHWRWKRRRTVLPAELAQHFAWHPTTAWRALERLAAAEWARHDGTGYAPLRPLPKAAPLRERDWELVQAGAGLPRGFLKVPLKSVRELGELEACALAQLHSMPAHAKQVLRADAEGRAGAPAGYLASRFGIHRDTARAVLERLATGRTRRYRLSVRRHEHARLVPHIELRKAAGRVSRFRELGEREKAKASTITLGRRMPTAETSDAEYARLAAEAQVMARTEAAKAARAAPS